MPNTTAQQNRIDAAQTRLTDAKNGLTSNVNRYNDWTASIQGCYTDHFADATAAATWYNPTQGPCTGKGKCDLSNCKNVVDKLNNDIIPALRNAYNELNGPNGAQANFNQVIADIAKENNVDPAIQLAQHKADADAAAKAASVKLKWIFAIVVVILAVAAYFIYKKFLKS